MTLNLPINAHQAVACAQRSMRRGSIVRIMILGLAGMGILLETVGNQQTPGGLMLLCAVGVWLMLSARTVKMQQSILRVGMLLEARQFTQAEQTLAGALCAFSLYKPPVIHALQNLTAMRYAQSQFNDVRILANALLQLSATPQALRPTRLMLADAALRLDDVPTAFYQLSLVQSAGAMPLREQLKNTELQVEYCIRLNAWAQAMEYLPWKIEVSDLLPAPASARLQAMLATAAHNIGRSDWRTWFERRVQLLTPASVNTHPASITAVT
jgi:ABC-type uncharacterized transport system permease subunit